MSIHYSVHCTVNLRNYSMLRATYMYMRYDPIQLLFESKHVIFHCVHWYLLGFYYTPAVSSSKHIQIYCSKGGSKNWDSAAQLCVSKLATNSACHAYKANVNTRLLYAPITTASLSSFANILCTSRTNVDMSVPNFNPCIYGRRLPGYASRIYICTMGVKIQQRADFESVCC